MPTVRTYSADEVDKRLFHLFDLIVRTQSEIVQRNYGLAERRLDTVWSLLPRFDSDGNVQHWDIKSLAPLTSVE